jgi:hypothetical protein
VGVSLRPPFATRYRIEKGAFQNADENPTNCAFGNFGPSGVLNMSDIIGAPVFASKPYFLDGSPEHVT